MNKQRDQILQRLYAINTTMKTLQEEKNSLEEKLTTNGHKPTEAPPTEQYGRSEALELLEIKPAAIPRKTRKKHDKRTGKRFREKMALNGTRRWMNMSPEARKAHVAKLQEGRKNRLEKSTPGL